MTWRTGARHGGTDRRDGDRVCAGQPLDRVRGRHHTALRSSRQWLLRLERRRCDLAGTRLEVDRRDLPAATRRPRSTPSSSIRAGRSRSTPSRTGSCAGASTAAPRGPSPAPGCRRPSTSPRGAAATRSGPRRHALLRDRRRSGPARSTARSTAGPPGGLRASAFRPSCRAGRCWRWQVTRPRGGLIYAATGRGLYATTNSGRLWRRALADPSTAVETAHIAGRPAVVIASQRRGLVRRVGAAGAWRRLPGPPGGMSLFTLDPAEREPDLRRGLHAERSHVERVRDALGIRHERCGVALGRACASARAQELPLRARRPPGAKRTGDSPWSIDSSAVQACGSRRSRSARWPSAAGAGRAGRRYRRDGARRQIGHRPSTPASIWSTPRTSTPAALSEEILGEALGPTATTCSSRPRCRLPMGDGPNDAGSVAAPPHPRPARRACAGSAPTTSTCTRCTSGTARRRSRRRCRARLTSSQSGKVRYIGCSNYAGWQLMKALRRRRAAWLAALRRASRSTTRCRHATPSTR